jgi:hypothetical protein
MVDVEETMVELTELPSQELFFTPTEHTPLTNSDNVTGKN